MSSGSCTKCGRRTVALDTLETGFREAVLHGELAVGDIADRDLVRDVLRRFRVKSVIHLAAHTSVAESVADPLRYYRNNTGASRALIECCVAEGVERFIFSSSAAVYGAPDVDRITERTPADPVNPYGASEGDDGADAARRLLRDRPAPRDPALLQRRRRGPGGAHRTVHEERDPLWSRSPARRRLAGAATCRSTAPTTPRRTAPASATTSMSRTSPTPTSSPSRSLEDGAESDTFNCGYGRGYSVREVIAAVERAAGVPIDAREAPRRPGDPPRLVADATRIGEVLGWTPRFDDLDEIVRTSLSWERILLGRE